MILVIAAGTGVALASGWNIANVGAIATLTASSYGVSLAMVGLFTTALFVTHAAMQVPGGRASDRFGARRSALAALVVIAAGAAISAIEPVASLALAGRAITGVGTGLAFIAGSAYVREASGSTLAQGLFGGVGLGAGGLALAVVPQLEGALSWRAPYVTALAVAIAALGLLALAPPEPEHARAARREHPRAGVLGDRRLYRLAVMYAASFGLGAVTGNWVVELLDRHSDATGSTAAVVGALTLLLGVVTRPLGGWILRRHPGRVRAAVGASLLAAALGTVALIAAGPAWLGALGGVLIGLGAGIPFAPAFTGPAGIRPDAPAAAVGLVNGSAAVVVLVGTPLLGLSFSLPGDGRIGFAVIAALWLVALATLPSARALGAEPRRRSPLPAVPAHR